MATFRHYILFTFSLSSMLIMGCNSGYEKIHFCWTSDHYLPPQKRIISLDHPINQVANATVDWIEKQKGVIVTFDKDAKKRAEMIENATNNYMIARQIAEKEWIAYDTNKYRKWKNGEWVSLQEHSKKQILIENYNGKCNYIKAKLKGDEVKFNYSVQTDTKMTPMYNPGFTAYSPTSSGFKTVSVHGYMMYVPTATYEARSKNIDFYSLIEIYIYEENNIVKVYAKASPYDDSISLVADYGRSIGYSFWPYVTGNREAKIVEQLLNDLTKEEIYIVQDKNN